MIKVRCIFPSRHGPPYCMEIENGKHGSPPHFVFLSRHQLTYIDREKYLDAVVVKPYEEKSLIVLPQLITCSTKTVPVFCVPTDHLIEDEEENDQS